MSDPKVLTFPEDATVRRHRSVVPEEDMPQVDCAFCGSGDTEPTSIYGSNMMFAQYYCRACKSTFAWVRDD